MIIRGEGRPLVLIPGIQGRWEWMKPAVDALATGLRVASYSLCGEPGSRCRVNREAGFENFMRQLDRVLDRANMARAAVCGVSYGGLIALHYAATRPERVDALVLVSAPGPRWRPDRQVAQYQRRPVLLAPLFVARSPARLGPEVAAALPRSGPRLAFTLRCLARIVGAPTGPRRMSERLSLAAGVDFLSDCGRITAPTLVMTGESHLDRVVPAGSTQEYAREIRHARLATLERTGHIGLVTRPQAFAGKVVQFLNDTNAGRMISVP